MAAALAETMRALVQLPPTAVRRCCAVPPHHTQGLAITTLGAYQWLSLQWLALRGLTPRDEVEQKVVSGQVS